MGIFDQLLAKKANTTKPMLPAQGGNMQPKVAIPASLSAAIGGAMKPPTAADPKIQAQMNMGNSLAGLAANAPKPSMPTTPNAGLQQMPKKPNMGNPLAMFGNMFQGGKPNLQGMMQGMQNPAQAAAMANFFRNMFQKK